MSHLEIGNVNILYTLKQSTKIVDSQFHNSLKVIGRSRYIWKNREIDLKEGRYGCESYIWLSGWINQETLFRCVGILGIGPTATEEDRVDIRNNSELRINYFRI